MSEQKPKTKVKYLQQIRESEELEFLLRNHPNAFLLLTLIAQRASRSNNSVTGLNIGECYIGDHQSCGLTRQQYRTAIEILKLRKHILICETCRNRKKSTTGSTTVGTKVKLISSTVYDINPEEDNHHINHRPTTDQPPTNHEEECKEDKNVKKKKKNIKKKVFTSFEAITCFFGEHVQLTKSELQELVGKFGHELVMWKIQSMESYVVEHRNGRSYKKIKDVLAEWCQKELAKSGKITPIPVAPAEIAKPKMGKKPKQLGAQNE